LERRLTTDSLIDRLETHKKNGANILLWNMSGTWRCEVRYPGKKFAAEGDTMREAILAMCLIVQKAKRVA
jgi:hypothetical protein